MDLKRKSGVAQATIGRILRAEVGAGVHTLARLAACYKAGEVPFEAWQILIPDFDPANPPLLAKRTEEERALYERMRLAAERLADFTRQHK